MGHRELDTIQTVAIIELLNWFARGHIAEILAEVGFSEAVTVSAPHAELHFVVCVHDAGVKNYR